MTAQAPTTPPRGTCRPVAQYDAGGIKIGEFPSVVTAARAVGVQSAAISFVISGRQRTAGGFFWRPLDGGAPDVIEIKPAARRRRVTFTAQHPDEPLDLFAAYARTRDPAIRSQLAEHFYGLVLNVARKVHGRLPGSVQLGDLVSAGSFGLLDAIEKFDVSRATRFTTYASRRIRGQILDWLRDQDYVPRVVRQRVRQVENAKDELRAKEGLEPTSEQVAAHLNISSRDYAAAEADARVRGLSSLSQPLYRAENGRDVRGADVLIDSTAADPSSDPEHTSLRDVLLARFDLREALMIKCYYQHEMTMKEIGEALDLSESRISQMHTNVLASLKGRFEFDELRELIAEAA